ncbi:MAG: aminotransferase class I/II-fold pyridoxal phosphate-dependent enzyme [Enterobacteriaceae bacterium]
MRNKKQSIHVNCRWLASQITDYSIRGIANKVSELVHAGDIAVGSYLPPVRGLATQLGVSRTTISTAWGLLRKQRMISGGRSQGVWVNSISGPRPKHSQPMGNFFGIEILNLSWSAPDPLLLPDLDQIMRRGTTVSNLNSYQMIPISPELEQVVRARWPYQAEAFMAIDGGFEGFNNIILSQVLPGSIVALEIPASPLLIDMLEYINATIIPVHCDEQGPILDDLAEAISRNPVAFIYNPNTHSVTGHSLSQQRLKEMAKLLSISHMLIIEKEDISDLSTKPFYSLGSVYPDRTLYIRSYSNAYGPDLRLAVISGPDTLINKVQAFRHFGCSWCSRLLQGMLCWMMQDAVIQQQIADARASYQQRRQALADALVERGVKVNTEQHDGLSLWLKVSSEQYALTTLTSRGVIVLPGSRCGDGTGHIRITTSQLTPESVLQVADALAFVYLTSDTL